MKNKIWSTLLDVIKTAIGCALFALGFDLFLEPYGMNSGGISGLAMVLVHLLQDATYTPRYVADFAEDNKYYAKGSGSKWALISEGGETLGNADV